jgi:hypothetical protein
MNSQSAVIAEDLVRRSGTLMADVTLDFLKEIGVNQGHSLRKPNVCPEMTMQDELMKGDQLGVNKGELLTTNLPHLYEVHVESVEGSPIPSKIQL